MASYLQVENISKSYGDRMLFSGIGFNINEGDKIALIAAIVIFGALALFFLTYVIVNLFI